MADKQISDLTPASALTDATLFVAEQSGAAKSVNFGLLKSYISPDNAPLFSTSVDYVVNDYVIYNTNLYRFTAAKAAGAWDSSKVVQTTVGAELKALHSPSAIAPVYSTSSTYPVGAYVYHDGTLYRCATAITTAESWTAAHWTAAVIGKDVSDIKSAINVLTKLESSSFGSGTSTASGKRILLNYDKAIPSRIFVGDLYMVAHTTDTTTNVRVEFAKKNADNSYTVYDSFSTSISISTTVGDLVKVCSINKVTQNETYVFVVFGTNNRFEMASISGKYTVVGDDISNTTFTTRVVNNYELDYRLYCGSSPDYIIKMANDIEYLYNAVGDYENFVFGSASVASGSYWNNYIYKSVPSGTKVRFELANKNFNFPVSIRAYDANNNNQIIGNLNEVGGVIEGELTLDAVYYRIFANPATALTNVQISIVYTDNAGTGITNKSFWNKQQRVYHVEKDGSGDYTNIADALEVATQWMDSIVYVGPGIWNILDELGETRLAKVSSAYGGIVLKNRVHVVCSSKCYIKCLYSGSEENIIEYLSAFNAGPYGFTLENADIEVANIRYCVHDERNAETDHYDNYYINCRMKNTNTTPGSRSQCIGGGLGYDGHIVIDGCTFENPLRENYGIVSYHNAHGAATDSRSLIEVKGSYFYGSNTFHALYYGNSTAITQCLVHGNSMGAEPYVTQADPNYTNVNMEIVKWNNEIHS